MGLGRVEAPGHTKEVNYWGAARKSGKTAREMGRPGGAGPEEGAANPQGWAGVGGTGLDLEGRGDPNAGGICRAGLWGAPRTLHPEPGTRTRARSPAWGPQTSGPSRGRGVAGMRGTRARGAGPAEGAGSGSGVCVGKSNCATGRSGPPSPGLGEGGAARPPGRPWGARTPGTPPGTR